MKVDYTKVLTLVLNIVQAVQNAAEDKKITFGEAVEIGYNVANQTLDLLNMRNKPLIKFGDEEGS